MKEQYGEYEIRYDENQERFTAHKDGEQIAYSAKLPELRKKLDRVGVVRAKFQRFKVLSIEARSRFGVDKTGLVEWDVTSVVQGSEVWVSSGPNRKKTHLKPSHYEAFYADTPENRTKIAGVIALYKEREALDAKIEAATNAIERATVPSGVETEAG